MQSSRLKTRPTGDALPYSFWRNGILTVNVYRHAAEKVRNSAGREVGLLRDLTFSIRNFPWGWGDVIDKSFDQVAHYRYVWRNLPAAVQGPGQCQECVQLELTSVPDRGAFHGLGPEISCLDNAYGMWTVRCLARDEAVGKSAGELDRT